MKCEGVTACKKKARFKFSTDNGMSLALCGLHLLKIIRRMRAPVSRGITTIFIQKYRETPFTMEKQ